MTTIAVVLAIPGLYILLLDAVFLAELLFGLPRLRGDRPAVASGSGASCVVLMPAHDEAISLTRAAPFLAALVADQRRVLVVADNCTDDTAALARAAGVDVVERHDADARGKGYALAFGREELRCDAPAVVIVLDADCELTLEGIDLLAARAMAEQRPVQAAYLLRPDLTASPVVQLSNFAFLIKNLFRQRGLVRLHVSPILTGAGMAIPWKVFDRLPLATGNIVEDLAMTVDLVNAQMVIGFEDAAQVWSDCSSETAMIDQRARWEAGFLATGFGRAPMLLLRGCARRSWPMVWLGLHLLVPPLTLLIAANLVGIVMGLIFGWLIGSWLLVVIVGALTSTLVVIAIGLIAAWYRAGYGYVGAATLLRIPTYGGWKLMLYAQVLLRKRRPAWIRTERAD